MKRLRAAVIPSGRLQFRLLKRKTRIILILTSSDATKVWPEELVPVQPIGEFELNKTVEEYFPEVEQVAFCTSHVVPGIGFSDDPLLQGRNFSYFDTQISRLGINWEQASHLPVHISCILRHHLSSLSIVLFVLF